MIAGRPTRSVCILVAGLLASVAAYGGPQDDLRKLREDIQALQQQLEKERAAKADETDRLKDSERAISHSAATLYTLKAQQAETAAALAALQREQAELNGRMREQQAALQTFIKAYYERGGAGELKILFSGRHPADIARELHYYGYLARARTELMANLNATLAALDRTLAESEAKRRTLSEVAAGQVAEQQRLGQERLARQRVLTALNQRISLKQREIGNLKQNEKALTGLIQRLERIAAQEKERQRQAARRQAQQARQKTPSRSRQPAPQARMPSAPTPLRSAKFPVAGELLNRFGSPRRDTGTAWKGLFFRAPAGAPVKAARDGQVVFADWMRGFGNLLIVDHGDGYMSLYGNNEALLKAVGDAVHAGEPIASVGNTGGQPEPGLYFEVRYRSRPVDPLTWMKGPE